MVGVIGRGIYVVIAADCLWNLGLAAIVFEMETTEPMGGIF